MEENIQIPIVISINDEPTPRFKLYPLKVEDKENVGALSSLPLRVMLTEDIRNFIHKKVAKLEDYEINKLYNTQLRIEINLKDENKHLETKGLMQIAFFPKFIEEWIKYVLSHVHEIFMLLYEENPIRTNNKILNSYGHWSTLR